MKFPKRNNFGERSQLPGPRKLFVLDSVTIRAFSTVLYMMSQILCGFNPVGSKIQNHRILP